MARHLAHAVLAAALLAEALLLPHTWLLAAMPATLVLFALCIGFLVVWPRTQVFVPTTYRASAAAPRIAFTFDDGPDAEWTPRILDVLAAHQAKGTFFVVGERAMAHPALVARIAREGHEVGCHTDTHSSRFHFWTARRIARDLSRAQSTLAGLLGKPARMFRPPQGLRVPQLQNALDRLELRPRCVTWTARGLDSLDTTAERIHARLEPAVRAGHILTLHDGTGFGGGQDRSATVVALGQLLGVARSRGLACVSLTELLEDAG